MTDEYDATPTMSGALRPASEEGPAQLSIEELRNTLYARCANQPPEKTFNQDDLLAFGIIPNDDPSLLHACTHQLTQKGLLKVYKQAEGVCWKVVKKEDAAKYKVLSDEEAVLYALVESSGREGMWTKHLRSKTQMHQTTLIRCLRTLENRNYIKPTRNVKYPGRKNYMLAHLQPSEAATGGPFYTDGVLDDEFVHQMSTWAERYIIGRSWSHRPQSESSKRKNLTTLNKEQAEQLRAEEIARGNVGRDRNKEMLPMPPGYTGYPKLSEITKAINASGLSGVLMKEAEMLQLLNILVWDAKVERVPSIKGYRAVRRVPKAGGLEFENGFTEAPCGRCPVFEICEEGGPVNATTCEYFEDWLNVL